MTLITHSDKVKNKTRESGIELLRIIAMLMVMFVHADFLAMGAPNSADIVNNVADASVRVWIQTLTVCCVDIFVLISGWFSINPKIKSVSAFLFQCLFFYFGIYIVLMLLGQTSLSVKGLKICIVATKLNWFIKSYLFLYILAPVLNIYVQQVDRKTQRNVLLAFYSMLFVYGWLFDATYEVANGCSTLSFIGLYLIARYIRVFQPKIVVMSPKRYLLINVFVVSFITVLFITPPYWGILNSTFLGNVWISNISPLIVMISVFFLLYFANLRFKSLFINIVAASSFAAFLLHANPNISPWYLERCKSWHDEFGILCWGYITVFIVFLFALSIIIDQIRLCIWRCLSSKMFKN